MKTIRHIKWIVCLMLMAIPVSVTFAEQPLRVEAVAEKSSVFAGESILLQIRVSGSDRPDKPVIPNIDGCTVDYQGGQQNSSSSITIINGQVSKNIQTGYVFSYRLTPVKPGRLVIPQITVQADGQNASTRPVILTVQKPVETDDFKLRIRLSKTDCYIGEPVVMEFTWYMGKDVRSLQVMLPLLESDAFFFADPKVDTKDGGQYYRIPLGQGEAIGKMGKGSIDGREYATLTFRKILIPKQAGTIKIQPATGVAEALAGYRQQKSPFADDFFSDFFKDDLLMRGRGSVYKKVIVPSNALSLSVSDLPVQGRPKQFAGHVGEYKISAAASPIEANVGDPITLKVIVSGPAYLEDVELPPLDRQENLAADFKIPKEQAAGEVTDRGKVFTQTIRANRPGIEQIPAIELSYFDTKTGQYKVARSEPIPVTIKKARIVTAMDAEGLITPMQSNGSLVESWGGGIAHNYEDLSILENQPIGLGQWMQSPLWLGIIGIPPLLFCMLAAGVMVYRRKQADPQGRRAKQAFSVLEKKMKPFHESGRTDLQVDGILEAFRHYLGDKLQLPAGAGTFGDVRETLISRGIDPEIISQLKDFFDRCEAESYAGGAGGIGCRELALQAMEVAGRLEKRI
ncbi:MAG: BatD family protein [Pseudomonadota bacterium]